MPDYVQTFITKGQDLRPLHLYLESRNKKTILHVSSSTDLGVIQGILEKRAGESPKAKIRYPKQRSVTLIQVDFHVVSVVFSVLSTMALSKPNQRDLSVHFATGFFEAEAREVIARKDLYGDSATWDIERMMFNKLVGLLKQALTYFKRHRKGILLAFCAQVLIKYANTSLIPITYLLAPNFHEKAAEILRSVDAQIEVVSGVLTSLEADKTRVITLLTYLWPDYLWTYIVTKLLSQVELDTIKVRGLKFGYVAKQSIMKLRNAITFVFSYGYLPEHYHRLFMNEENYKLWRQFAETRFPIADMLKRPHFVVLREHLQVFNLTVEALNTLDDDDNQTVEVSNLL